MSTLAVFGQRHHNLRTDEARAWAELKGAAGVTWFADEHDIGLVCVGLGPGFEAKAYTQARALGLDVGIYCPAREWDEGGLGEHARYVKTYEGKGLRPYTLARRAMLSIAGFVLVGWNGEPKGGTYQTILDLASPRFARPGVLCHLGTRRTYVVDDPQRWQRFLPEREEAA